MKVINDTEVINLILFKIKDLLGLATNIEPKTNAELESSSLNFFYFLHEFLIFPYLLEVDVDGT